MESIFIKAQEDHPFKLDNYEGPLDLLLSLIKDAKIDIKDIFVSKITDQYINYIKSIDIIDLDKASDFITMAATLLEIKSDELLPKEDELEMEEYVDEKHELQRQLELYNIIQQASMLLQLMETKHRFCRHPEYSEDDCRLVFEGASVNSLVASYANMMCKLDFKLHDLEPKSIEKDEHTVAEKVLYLADFVNQEKSVNFFDLFLEDFSRSSVLNTFLALLELLKRQVLSAEQDKLFGDIQINFKDGGEAVSLEEFVDGESDRNH